MFKKFLIGFGGVALACLIAGSGYQFGKALAQRDAQVETGERAATG
jgi:hypothetical protein